MIKRYSFADKLFSGMIFKLVNLALVFVSFNAFFYYLPAKKYLVLFVTAFGALNCLYRVVCFKRFVKMPYLILGIMYIASYIVTTLVNIRYGLTESFQGLVWLTFQMLLLYCIDMEKPIEELKTEYKRLSLVFISYITVACVVSILMLVINYGELYAIDAKTLVPRGFIWGRLWGVFSDPNLGSVSVCISIILSLFFFIQAEKSYQRILIVISLVASFLYLAFSDSRTGYLAVLCSLIVWIFVRFLVKNASSENRSVRKEIFHRITAAAISMLIALSVVGAIIVTKQAYNMAISYYQENNPHSEYDLQIKRSSYEEQTDFSNRRMDLWESGVELFEQSPIVGVGFRNIEAAARDMIPDTYLVDNSFGVFDAFHNMWLDLLVSQGIVGFLIFLVFALFCIKYALRGLLLSIKNKSDETAFVGTLLAAAIPPLVVSMLQADTILFNTPNAVMFWILLGYLIRMTYYENKKSKTTS